MENTAGIERASSPQIPQIMGTLLHASSPFPCHEDDVVHHACTVSGETGRRLLRCCLVARYVHTVPSADIEHRRSTYLAFSNECGRSYRDVVAAYESSGDWRHIRRTQPSKSQSRRHKALLLSVRFEEESLT